jgi:hypothetical protein
MDPTTPQPGILQVGIATGYGLDSQNLIPGSGKTFFCAPQRPDLLWPTQPPIQWVPRATSPGVIGRGVKLTTHPHLVMK